MGQGHRFFSYIFNFRISKKKKYNLYKLNAGIVSKNISSKKILIKNHFKQEGVYRSHILIDGKRYNKLDFGKII